VNLAALLDSRRLPPSNVRDPDDFLAHLRS
jgi:hypothetical protein